MFDYACTKNFVPFGLDSPHWVIDHADSYTYTTQREMV